MNDYSTKCFCVSVPCKTIWKLVLHFPITLYYAISQDENVLKWKKIFQTAKDSQNVSSRRHSICNANAGAVQELYCNTDNDE